MVSEQISYEELQEQLLAMEPLRDRALLCLTYAVLGRVGEVVRARYDHNNTPIRKEQLELIDTHLIVHLLTEKRKQERRVPINRTKEAWLIEPILAYAELVDGELFPYSTRWAENIFLKNFGTHNIHMLRHWRITHLLNGSATGKRLRTKIVAKMAGHGDTRTIERVYDHTVIEDYLDEI